MKRIRTIFVALVILLVSMTMVLSAGAATPVDSSAGTESTGILPPDGGGLQDGGDDDIVPPLPGCEGDPDDGLEGDGTSSGSTIKGDTGFIGWMSSSDVSAWGGLLDLWIILQVMVP